MTATLDNSKGYRVKMLYRGKDGLYRDEKGYIAGFDIAQALKNKPKPNRQQRRNSRKKV